MSWARLSRGPCAGVMAHAASGSFTSRGARRAVASWAGRASSRQLRRFAAAVTVAPITGSPMSSATAFHAGHGHGVAVHGINAGAGVGRAHRLYSTASVARPNGATGCGESVTPAHTVRGAGHNRRRHTRMAPAVALFVTPEFHGVARLLGPAVLGPSASAMRAFTSDTMADALDDGDRHPLGALCPAVWEAAACVAALAAARVWRWGACLGDNAAGLMARWLARGYRPNAHRAAWCTCACARAHTAWWRARLGAWQVHFCLHL